MNEACNLEDYDILGLGWDVGGWMGNNHGFALAGARTGTGTIKWPGEPVELGIPEGSSFNLKEIIGKITGRKDVSLGPDQLIIGVDAPLGFPQSFKNFIVDGDQSFDRPEKEIYNPLAYRKTERFIYEKLGKKPLSAPFDRIGTNATVAISHARRWSRGYGFSREPSSEGGGKGGIIEVYPGLLKPDKGSAAYQPFKKILPGKFETGTHYYDAALCSIMALAHRVADDIPPLPPLVGPPELTNRILEEGWVYHFSDDSIVREAD